MEQTRNKQTGLELIWAGNNGWIIRGDGICIATDLILDDPIRIRKSSVAIEQFAPALDAIFLTHEHSDHFHEGTCTYLLEHSPCKFVVPLSCLQKARALGIPQTRIIAVQPRQTLRIESMTVETVRAIHGHIGGSIYEGASTNDCGYLFTLCGRRIYQPGDTVLLQEHQEQLGDVDVLFISPTEHNTYIAQSKTLIELLHPADIFIQHFGTFAVTPENAFWTVGHQAELLQALDTAAQKRVHIPREGERYVIE